MTVLDQDRNLASLPFCYLSVMGAPELVYLRDLDRNQEVVPLNNVIGRAAKLESRGRL